MGFMPANSVLLIDESSAALASRVGHGVSVSSFVEMNLKNTRKRNCVVVYMSAQDWEISASIRRNCREVWMPVPKDDLDVADSMARLVASGHSRPAAASGAAAAAKAARTVWQGSHPHPGPWSRQYPTRISSWALALPAA